MTLREIKAEIGIFFSRSWELAWLKSSWLDAEIQYVAGAIFLYLYFAFMAVLIIGGLIRGIASIPEYISSGKHDWRRGGFIARTALVVSWAIFAAITLSVLLGLFVVIFISAE